MTEKIESEAPEKPNRIAADLLEKSPQLITAAVAIGIAYSTLFNLGYFIPIGFEYLTYLSFQDLLEGTLPFLLAGFLGIFLYISIDFAPHYEKKTLKAVLKRHQDEFRTLWAEAKTLRAKGFLVLVGVPIILIFFILQLLGNYILYFYLFVFARGFRDAIAEANTPTVFADPQYGIYILAAIIVLVDMFIRREKTELIVNKTLLRFTLITAVIAGFSGTRYLAKQLKNPPNWDISFVTGEAKTDVLFLRSVDKGILVFDRRNSTISLYPHQVIAGVELEMQEKVDSKKEAAID